MIGAATFTADHPCQVSPVLRIEHTAEILQPFTTVILGKSDPNEVETLTLRGTRVFDFRKQQKKQGPKQDHKN